jgi:hypothetical protein
VASSQSAKCRCSSAINLWLAPPGSRDAEDRGHAAAGPQVGAPLRHGGSRSREEELPPAARCRNSLTPEICSQHSRSNVQQARQNQPQVNVVADTTGSTKIGSPQSPPHFTHLAMCELSKDGTPGVTPPLGWVLSDKTRDRFKQILDDCENPDQLNRLVGALGLQLQP